MLKLICKNDEIFHSIKQVRQDDASHVYIYDNANEQCVVFNRHTQEKFVLKNTFSKIHGYIDDSHQINKYQVLYFEYPLYIVSNGIKIECFNIHYPGLLLWWVKKISRCEICISEKVMVMYVIYATKLVFYHIETGLIMNEIDVSEYLPHTQQQEYLYSFRYHDHNRMAIFAFMNHENTLILEINDDYTGIMNAFTYVKLFYLYQELYFIIGRVFTDNNNMCYILNKKTLAVIEQFSCGEYYLTGGNQYDPCSHFVVHDKHRHEAVYTRTLFPQLMRKYCSFLFLFNDDDDDQKQELLHRMKHCYLRNL